MAVGCEIRILDRIAAELGRRRVIKVLSNRLYIRAALSRSTNSFDQHPLGQGQWVNGDKDRGRRADLD